MSDESEKFEISLNAYALISIVKALQAAKEALKAGEMRVAVIELDFAWGMLPNRVRAKFADRPSVVLGKRFSEKFPDRKAVAEKYIPQRLVQYPGTPAVAKTWAENDAKKEMDDALNEKIIPEVFGELLVAFISELDAQGAYIQFGGIGGFPTPTSRGQKQQKPPADKMYDPGLSREVEG